MKKRTLVITLSIVLAICIGLTIYLFAYPDPIGGKTRGSISRRTDRAITILNENLAGNIFAFGDTWDYSEPEPDGFEYMGGFGMHSLYSEDQSVHYDFSGFPDTLDKTQLTDIFVESASSPITLFGFGLGGNADKLMKALVDAGFKQEEYREITANDYTLSYSAGAARVSFHCDASNTITVQLRIYLISTNLFHVIY
jgi:hypothetical protein